MDINRQNMNDLFQAMNKAFQAGVAARPRVDLSFLFFEAPSVTASNLYPWLDRIPGFREWVGDRIYNNVRSQRYEVLNRKFEDSVRVLADDVSDDQYGIYAPLMQMMGEAWQELRYKLVTDVLINNPLSFTGKAFFATDHAYGENTIANLTASALTQTTFEAAFTAASAWKFSSNELCKPLFTHLVHGPKLHATAFGIVDAEKISDDADNLVSNPNYKRVTRVELPEFSGAAENFWCLVDGGRAAIKPIVRQIRKEAVPLMDTDPATIERTGFTDLMASGRGEGAPTFPHLIYMGRPAQG
jgi:phage major head subunit gpT-like protein